MHKGHDLKFRMFSPGGPAYRQGREFGYNNNKKVE